MCVFGFSLYERMIIKKKTKWNNNINNLSFCITLAMALCVMKLPDVPAGFDMLILWTSDSIRVIIKLWSGTSGINLLPSKPRIFGLNEALASNVSV